LPGLFAFRGKTPAATGDCRPVCDDKWELLKKTTVLWAFALFLPAASLAPVARFVVSEEQSVASDNYFISSAIHSVKSDNRFVVYANQFV
jgi:hypothetical protein